MSKYIDAEKLNPYDEGYKAGYAQGRREVAREMFEEFEYSMSLYEDDDDGYLLKKCEFEFFIRELKKKYAEV